MSSTPLNQRDNSKIFAASISILVSILAFLLRAPSCYESFWLDELHSTWCVWGHFSEIQPRASAGHQTPLFYWMLWIWKQIFGDSEFALRMISVAAVSAASGLSSYLIASNFRSTAAGFTAGMVLAIEQNSIFFGTELRPYSLIILLSNIVVLGYLRLLNRDQVKHHDLARSWIIVSAFAAVSVQVTSAAVVLVFVLLSQLQKKESPEQNDSNLTPAKWFIFALGFFSLICAATMTGGISESWQQRGLWQSFGTSQSFNQISSVWQWKWLLGIPLTISFITMMLSGVKHSWNYQGEVITAILTLSLIATIVTVAFWLVSYPPIAPLWHRRYFVGLLPVFSAVAGLSILLPQRLRESKDDLSVTRKLILHPWLLSCLIITGLAWSQNTLQRIHRYPVAYARRGEDWRDAMKYISDISSPSDSLWLAPGLIEEALYRSDSSGIGDGRQNDPERISLQSYLLYPSQGPYKIETPFRLWQDRSQNRFDKGKGILLSRTPAHRFSKSLQASGRLKSFGNLTVITLKQDL